MSSSPCLIPRAITPSARKGSNIRGKIVTKSILNMVEVIEAFRKSDDDPLRFKIDLRADVGSERDIERSLRALNAQQDPSAALFGVHHHAADPAFRVDHRHPHEVMEKVLVFAELAGVIFRDLDRPVLKFAKVFRRLDPGKLHQGAAEVGTRGLDADTAG